MTDAKTQRMVDELVTLRREVLALRLKCAQLEDVIRQRDAADTAEAHADAALALGGRLCWCPTCDARREGTLAAMRATPHPAVETPPAGQPAGSPSEAWAQTADTIDAMADYLVVGACDALAKVIGYADFDRGIPKAFSEEEGSV